MAPSSSTASTATPLAAEAGKQANEAAAPTPATSSNNTKDSLNSNQPSAVSGSTNSNGNTADAASSSEIEPFDHEKWKNWGVLRVPWPRPPKRWELLDRKLVPLFGAVPMDLPLEQKLTQPLKEADSRVLPPLTIRWQAQSGQGLAAEKARLDDIAKALWPRVQELLPDHPPHELRPSVVLIDEDEIFIDATFSSVEAFTVARNRIGQLQIELAVPRCSGDRMIFDQVLWANTLPRDVMPIDIFHFPTEDAKDPQLVASLVDMVAGIGSLLGAGFMQPGSAEEVEGTTTTRTTTLRSNILRLYVKLSRSSMKLDYDELLDFLPMLFRWHGAPLTLEYAGKEHFHPEKFSKDYPLVGGSTEGGDGATKIKVEQAASTSSGGNSNAAKKTGTTSASGGTSKKWKTRSS